VSSGIARALMLAATIALTPASAIAECGIASWYGPGFHGRQTANGETYNQHGISAAHKTLPLGSRVVVRNQRTGRSILVRINDRGPYAGGRIVDLSDGARRAIGMGGLAPVCLEVVSYGSGKRARSRSEHARYARAFAARARKLGRAAAAIPGRVIRDAHRMGRDIVTAPVRIVRDIARGGHRHLRKRHRVRHRARRHIRHYHRRPCWWCD
jgi:rare lipoprotein A (peptidoglycan hydrolase)